MGALSSPRHRPTVGARLRHGVGADLVRGYPVFSPVRRSAILATVFATVLILVLPFFGGAGPSPLSTSANAEAYTSTVVSVMQPIAPPPVASTVVAPSEVAVAAFSLYEEPVVATVLTADAEHLAQNPVPPPPPPPVVSKSSKASGTDSRRAALAAAGQSCPGNVGGSTGSAPSAVSGGGVQGTTSGDLASFASNYNAIRVANCLNPVPLGNFRYDSCMETRLFWMAQDPSTDPASAWGHQGSVRSDNVPSVGCDGNLAGGTATTGDVAAAKWWASAPHRAAVYRPDFRGDLAHACVGFAAVHGGAPDDSPDFVRSASRWYAC